MIKTVLKYLLAPLFPILVQADQATVASEEAAQGFQTLFDWINRLNQSELKESLNINLKTPLKLISFYEICTCYFSEVIWRPPNGLFSGMMNFEGQVLRFFCKFSLHQLKITRSRVVPSLLQCQITLHSWLCSVANVQARNSPKMNHVHC